jgi:hypothetical protein
MFSVVLNKTIRQSFLDADAPCAFVAGDANLRRYVGNDTTNMVDPSGLEEFKPGDIPVPGTLVVLAFLAAPLVPDDVMEKASRWVEGKGWTPAPAAIPPADFGPLPGVPVDVAKQLKVDVDARNKKVGILTVEYGQYKFAGEMPPQKPAIRASFRSFLGGADALKEAAKAFGGDKGDHFNWYQVITSDGAPPYATREGAKGPRFMAPYVDPPRDGYFMADGSRDAVAFDRLPWYWNDGVESGGRNGIKTYSDKKKVTFQDAPLMPIANTIEYKTWLVVVDKDGQFVEWAGVGFQWRWRNDGRKLDITNVKLLTGEDGKPPAAYDPKELFNFPREK